MSYDDYYDSDADYDQYMAELYQEHKKEALQEFTTERLQSYFLKNPDLAVKAIRMLVEARQLLEASPAAALVFASSAMELGLKMVLLRPVVYGLVHTDSTAGLVTDLTLAHVGMERFRNLLFRILTDHGGVDLPTLTRPGEAKTLWQEITEVGDERNRVLHRGEEASEEQAHRAINVAALLLENIFPALVARLGLHLHERMRVCGELKCRDSVSG